MHVDVCDVAVAVLVVVAVMVVIMRCKCVVVVVVDMVSAVVVLCVCFCGCHVSIVMCPLLCVQCDCPALDHSSFVLFHPLFRWRSRDMQIFEFFEIVK